MTVSYIEAVALCPYYQRDDKNIIVCEVGELITRDKFMKREIGYGYCSGDFENCTFKIVLDNYYNRIDKKRGHL